MMSTTVPATPSLTERAALRRMIMSHAVTHVIGVTARLGLTDALADGPLTIDELAARVGADPATLARFVRALVGLGLVEHTGDGRATLTSAGALLRQDIPGSIRDWALHMSHDYFQQVWSGGLEHSVRTGEAAFPLVHGMSNWEYRHQHPELERAFNRSMTAMSAQLIPSILAAYDFSPYRRVVDVGGGRGHLVTAIIDANPEARGVVFDQPSVADDARTYLAELGLLDRCEVVGGSFFDAVPDGGDLYLLKAIIHDWPDEPSTKILRMCRQAMAPTARLLIIERVVRDGPDVPREVLLDDAFADMNMLVNQAGRERTEDEFRTLLGSAGLALRRVVPTSSYAAIVEAEPI
jgi:hypothetical protein